ncbi:hypothetical protein [Acidisoma silvae]|uniref:Uncharacterized protein n=1 Tax=Acidisoma silvae TaxID=2802396 RepID=A0A963YUQ9_9PROT|nr:hypothetical protein [Acidisoma silvae]MCB8877431.1 hypothetical protein [Acidisoma silvae]
MPDLRTKVVTDWLDAVRPVRLDDAWPPALRPVEASVQATGLLVEFGQILDQLAHRSPEALSTASMDREFQGDLQLVLAQVGTARALAFFHWLRATGLSDHLTIEDALLEHKTPAGRALFATVTTIARQATLQRLISIERMDELVSATDTANKESSNV